MLSAAVLADEGELRECTYDIREEVATFGEVVDFVIPRVGALEGHAETDVGSCFVRFAQVADAIKAQTALDGRQFDGQTVVAAFVPE